MSRFMKGLLLLLCSVSLHANALPTWEQGSVLTYYVEPEFLEAEPLIREDLQGVAAIPLNITLVETNVREGAKIKVLVNNNLAKLESTNFSRNKNGHTSRAIVWINMDRVRKFQEINFNNGIRNIVRHGFFHTLGAGHHKKFVYRPLMNQYLSTDKIYFTYDDRKQLRELYPTKKKPATIRKFKTEALGKTAYFICKNRPRSFQLLIVSESQPIWYLPSSECRVIIK